MKIVWWWENARNSILEKFNIDFYAYWDFKRKFLNLFGILLIIIVAFSFFSFAAYNMYMDTHQFVCPRTGR